MRQAHEAALASAIEFVEKVGQRDRVGPTRGRGDHSCLRSKQPVAPDRLSDAIQEIHKDWKGGRAGRAGGDGAWPSCLSCLSRLPARICGAGGQIRTVDPALMRRVLSPTELLRLE